MGAMTPQEIELATALDHCSGWTPAQFLDDMVALAKNQPIRELTGVLNKGASSTGGTARPLARESRSDDAA
jgi:hypothetical protein